MTHILATKPMIVDANLWCNRPHERFADMCHTLRDNSNLLFHRCGLIFCWDFCFLKLLMTNFYVTNKQSSEKKEMMTNQAMVHPCQFNTSAASEWKTANDRWEKWKEVHILLKALLAKNMTLPWCLYTDKFFFITRWKHKSFSQALLSVYVNLPLCVRSHKHNDAQVRLKEDVVELLVLTLLPNICSL